MISKVPKRKIWKLNKDLTVKSQILIISFLVSLLILGILLGAVLMSQDFITDALREASNKIFRLQTKAYMNIVWIHQYRIEEQIAKTMQHLATIRKINNLVQAQRQNGHEFQIQQPKMCLLDEMERDSYSLNNSICCGVFGKQLNQDSENQLKSIKITASLFHSLRQLYDFTRFSPISFQYDSDTQFYCFSYGLAFPDAFQPQQRPYYIETIEQMQNQTDPEAFYFTNPFSTLTEKIRCPMTTALLDLNKQFVGLVEKDLDFDYSQIEKPTIQNITSYVISFDGLVVFTVIYKIPSQPAFHLNESQYSGFDQQDFEQIMYKHYGQPFQSNCRNFDFVDILCRYNVLTKNNLIIRTANITESLYIMVVLSDTNEIKQEEIIHLQLLNDELKVLIQGIILSITLSSIISILLGQWSIPVILGQLNNIINKIHKMMLQNRVNFLQKKTLKQFLEHPIWNTKRKQISQFYKLFKVNIFQSRLVTTLTYKIVRLFNFINNERKCIECKLLERLKYPSTQPVQKRNLVGLKYTILYLKNFRRLPKRFQRQIVFLLRKIKKKIN